MALNTILGTAEERCQVFFKAVIPARHSLWDKHVKSQQYITLSK